MKKIILTLLAAISMSPAFSQDLLDKSDPESLFDVGFRLGFNASNRTFPNTPNTNYNNNSWGTGFDVGVVANLNIKEFLSIQPGVFFDSRSGNYSHSFWYTDMTGIQDGDYMGHYRSYDFTVPIMAVVKLSPFEKLKVTCEFGPYFQFFMKTTGKSIYVPYQPSPDFPLSSTYEAKYNKFDFGFKMGAGVLVLNHYYFGIHYLAGVCHAWKDPRGGHNKSWMFSIGYDL